MRLATVSPRVNSPLVSTSTCISLSVTRDRINRGADGKRIVHRRSRVAALFRSRNVKIRQLRNEVAFRPVHRLQVVQIFARDQRALAHIGADHGHHPAGIEDNRGRFRVVVDIGFGGSVHVSASDGTAHDHNVFHQRNDRRILRHSQRDVRQRSDRNQRDLVRILDAPVR